MVEFLPGVGEAAASSLQPAACRLTYRSCRRSGE